MKNIIRRGLCLLLLLAMTAAMAACGPKNTNTDADEKTMVYAVEAGSAGEDVAKEKGWTVNSVQDQAAALMEVAAGTSDAAVIDLLMAEAMIGPDTSYPNLTYTDSLTQEEYGIGCRQGSDLADFITSVLAEAYQDGTTQTLARQFGIREDLLAEMPQTGYTEDAGGDDTQLSVDDQLHVLGQIVGDQGGQADAQVHDVAVLQLLGAALGDKAFDLALFHYFLSPSTM